MTHDPLCPSKTKQARFVSETVEGVPQPIRVTLENGPCQCSLIAKVRADERNRCIAEVEKSWTLSHRITTGPIHRQYWKRKKEGI